MNAYSYWAAITETNRREIPLETQIDYNEVIEQINERKGFSLHNGLVLTRMEENYAEVEAKLTEQGLNVHGTAHGALLFALCDEVTAFAAYRPDSNMLTASANINFLRPGKAGTTLKAVGKSVKQGRSMSFVDAWVYDGEGALLCTASVIYSHKNP